MCVSLYTYIYIYMCVCVRSGCVRLRILFLKRAKKTHAYNMYIYIYTHASVCIHMAFGVREPKSCPNPAPASEPSLLGVGLRVEFRV